MSRAGFVQAVKARGKYYFYVRISIRNEFNTPVNKNLFGLGQKEKALLLLKNWLNDRKDIPEILRKYKAEDFERWISYIENK